KDDLILIDTDEKALEQSQMDNDAIVLSGNAVAEGTLKKAGAANADLFVAVTNSDEINIIAALRAKHLGAKRAVARVVNSVYFEGEYGLYNDMFGIDLVINPKFLAALEIHKLVRSPVAAAIEDFANNQIEMIQLPIEKNTRATHRPLHEVKMPQNVRIAGIVRAGQLIIPHGGDQIRVGDDVICIGKADEIPLVEQLFGRDRKSRTHYVIIVGGGDIGVSLARRLAEDGIDVRIVEQHAPTCLQLREMLPERHIEVVHGDGTHSAFLQELAVSACDVLVAASHKDEVNIMASLLAKELRAPRCIALIQRPDYAPLLKQLGVDASLSPRLLVAREVLKYVSPTKVLAVTTVMDGQGQFMEFDVRAGARIASRPLKSLDFPRGAMICAGFGAEGAFIARGDTQFQAGQRAIIFTTPRVRAAVERLF
ncbi:MAG: Trk system potassium transporter TrkA, partial [Myxococcota bacterium]|nr:Trk system potassium transporter TrkA [Myxococcota bacterium]